MEQIKQNGSSCFQKEHSVDVLAPQKLQFMTSGFTRKETAIQI